MKNKYKIKLYFLRELNESLRNLQSNINEVSKRDLHCGVIDSRTPLSDVRRVSLVKNTIFS